MESLRRHPCAPKPREISCHRCWARFVRGSPKQVHCSARCRLLTAVTVSASGCWEWQKSTVRGYGQFRTGKGRGWDYAHRVAWRELVGAIPETLNGEPTVVMHKCDNRLCCNPEHLRLGTQADNMADMAAKGRAWMKGRPLDAAARAKMIAAKKMRRAALLSGKPWPPPKPARLTKKQIEQQRLKKLSPAQLAAEASRLLYGQDKEPRTDYLLPKRPKRGAGCARCSRPIYATTKKHCRACFLAGAKSRRSDDTPVELPELGWEAGAPVPIHHDAAPE